MNAMSQCGQVSLIGEFNNWAGDLNMDRNPENPALFTAFISLDTTSNFEGAVGIIWMKFRENGEWTVNWGSNTFPSGTGTPGGPNIPVPIDTVSDATTDYFVTFNCETGEYNFESVCGSIGLIGEFTDWASDLSITRDPNDFSMWTAILSLDTSSNQYGALDTIEIKFRESARWATNWGANSFPSGVGTQMDPIFGFLLIQLLPEERLQIIL